MTEEQFRNIIMPHHRMMTGVAMAILGNREDALDCIQDSLLTLWDHRNGLSEVSNVKAYCIQTVKNNAICLLRRQNRLTDAMPEIVDRISPDIRLEEKDRLHKVMDMIEALPDTQRNVMKLSAIIGLSPDDVASLSGLSSGNVRTILSRTRKQLKKHFKQ